jgi:HSP20 family protein
MANLIPSRRNHNRGNLTQGRSDPWSMMRDEFDNLFNRFFGRLPAGFDFGEEFDRVWDFNVSDKGNEVIVRAELPGFEADDLDVQVNHDVLTIQAERKRENKEEHEFEERSFRRVVTLPAGVDADKAEASYRNGVLELRFPKTEQTQGKRISVRAQESPPLQQQATGKQATAQTATEKPSQTQTSQQKGKKA